MNMTKIFRSLIVLALFIQISLCGKIEPEAQNSIVGDININAGNQNLSFNFKVENGISQGQYIAVRLPKNDQAGSLIKWNFDVTALTGQLHTQSGELINITSEKSIKDENFVAYFKVAQTNGVVHHPKGFYRLTLVLPSAMHSTVSFWRNIDIFTLSAKSMTKTNFIDSAVGFGNGAITGDWDAAENVLFKLAKVEKTVKTDIMPYEKFDIKMQYEIMAGMRGEDSVIRIEYPNDNLISSLPDTYKSTDYVDPTKTKAVTPVPAANKALNGALTFTKVNANTHDVTGIANSDDWLNKGRKFNIIASGAVAGDGLVATQKIKVKIFYRNSMVIQSYSDLDMFTIKKPTLKLTAAHPETWDLYMSGAWPIKFTYQSDANLSPTSDPFVVIQHSNYNPIFTVWNFIASSCDFSDNTAWSKTFGERNNCYPTQIDLDFRQAWDNAASTTKTAPAASTAIGSGIWFRHKGALVKNTKYYVNVFGVADVCGKQGADGVADPLVSATSVTSFTYIQFNVNIYKKAHQDKIDSQRFNANEKLANTGLSVLGSSPKCWSTYAGSTTKGTGLQMFDAKKKAGSNPKTLETVLARTTTLYGKLIGAKGVQLSGGSAPYTQPKGDVLQYKEFDDPVFIKAPLPTALPTSGNYSFSRNVASSTAFSAATAAGVGYSPASKQFTPNYLISSTASHSVLGDKGAVLMRGDFLVEGSRDVVDNNWNMYGSSAGLPSPIFWLEDACKTKDQTAINAGKTHKCKKDNVRNLWHQQLGRVEILLSKQWFQASDVKGCVVSWHVGADKDYTPVNYKNGDNYTNKKLGNNMSYFFNPAAKATAQDAIAAFPTDAQMSTNKALMAKELRNTFIRAGSDATTSSNGTNGTIDMSKSIWPKADNTHNTIMIVSVANANTTTNPGGEFFTVNAPALGYVPHDKGNTYNDQANGWGCKVETNSNKARKRCSYTFHIYTNCLKWATASTTNKHLYQSFDVIYRFMPYVMNTANTSSAAAGNGPNRVIRFIKLYPEAMGMQDVAARTLLKTNTANPVSVWWTINAAQSMYNSEDAYKGRGAACVVEIKKVALETLKVSSTYNLGIFLYNLPLLEVDVYNPANVYPVAGLMASAKSYGLVSAPAYGRYGVWAGQGSKGTYAGGLTGGLTNYKTASDALLTPNYFTNLTSYGRSNHRLLLSSILIVSGISSGKYASEGNTDKDTSGSLLIPTYCPAESPDLTKYPTATVAGAGSVFVMPAIYITAFTGTTYNDITIKKILLSKSTNKEAMSIVIQAKPTKVRQDTNRYNYKQSIKIDVMQETSKIKISNNGKTVYGDAISAFMTDAYTVKPASGIYYTTDANKTSFVAGDGFNTFSKGSFYFFNKKFSQALLKVNTGNTALTTAYINNVSTPTDLSSFYNKTTKKFSAADNFAISLESSDINKMAYGTNYSSNTSKDQTLSSFGVTITGSTKLVTSSGVKDYEVTFNKLGTNYKDSKEGSFRMDITNPTSSFPAKIPAHAQLQLKFLSTLSASGNCAIIKANNLSYPCVVASQQVTCDLFESAAKYSVACYNVEMKAKADTYGLGSIGYIFGDIKSTNWDTNYVYGAAMTNKAKAVAQYNPDNANLKVYTNLVGTAKVTYSVNQANAIGQAIFHITIPRTPTYGGSVKLTGDFTNFYSKTYADKVRCQASFYKTFEYGDADNMIDRCELKNSANPGTLTVYFKNQIWKAGQAIPKIIYVSISPVKLGKMSDKKFIFAMENKSNSAMVSVVTTTSTVKGKDIVIKSDLVLPTKANANHVIIQQDDTLCPIKTGNATPRIPNSQIDYTFTFDLTTNKEKLTKWALDVNQVTIFFVPNTAFGNVNSIKRTQWCLVNGKRVQCSFHTEGYLNVSVPATKAGTNITVTVLGVQTGAIDGAKFKFMCTANHRTATGQVYNMLSGSGLLANDSNMEGIIGKSGLTNTKNLAFYEPITTSSKVLGDATTLGMKVAVSRLGVYTEPPKDIEITNYPEFHIYLPKEYNDLYLHQFNKNTILKPSIAVTDVSEDAKDSSKLITTNVVLKDTTHTGSRLSAKVNAKTLKILGRQRYFSITITGMINPTTSGATGPFTVILTNADYSWMGRNWVNNDTQFSTVDLKYNLSKTEVSSVITKMRGVVLNYSVNSVKWAVSLNGNNRIHINAGRFSQYAFTIIKKNPTANAKVATTTITTADKMFKFPANADYRLSTINLKQTVQIGTPCDGAVAGVYIMRFDSSNDIDFIKFSPVLVSLMTNTLGSLTVKQDAITTIKGGSVGMSYHLKESDTNYDVITGTWTGVKGKHDPSATITFPDMASNSVKTHGRFAISKTTVTTSQELTLAIKNKCFKPDTTSAVLTASDKTPVLNDKSGVDKWFVYNNPKTDLVLSGATPPMLNALRWTVTAKIFPVYVYCALLCKNGVKLTQADVIAGTPKVGFLTQLYNNMYLDATAKNMIFKGLSRAETYQLQCYVQTTQADAKARSTVAYSQTQMTTTVGKNTTYSDLTPKNVEMTQCLEFTMDDAMVKEADQKKIHQYCQDLFSPANNVNTGCVQCVNLINGMTVTGSKVNTHSTCRSVKKPVPKPSPFTSGNQTSNKTSNKTNSNTTKANVTTRRLRYLTTTKNTTNATANKTAANNTKVIVQPIMPPTRGRFSVCAVPATTCNSDITTGGILSVLKKMQTNLKTNALFKSTLGLDVKLNTTHIINDLKAPNITDVGHRQFTIYMTPVDFNLILSNYTLPEPYQCYWKAQDSKDTTAPTAQTVRDCNEPNCGKFIMGPKSALITKPFKSSAFKFNVIYSFYTVCYNRVPDAQNPSGVVIAGSYAIPCKKAVSPDGLTCGHTNKNDTKVSSASYVILMGLFSLVFMNALLFA